MYILQIRDRGMRRPLSTTSTVEVWDEPHGRHVLDIPGALATSILLDGVRHADHIARMVALMKAPSCDVLPRPLYTTTEGREVLRIARRSRKASS